MKYYTKTRWANWENDDTTICEAHFTSVKEAAEHVVSEGDGEAHWVIQCFVIHEDAQGFVRAAQDCTPEFITACFDEWAANYTHVDPPQIIADLVEQTYAKHELEGWVKL